MKVEDFEFGDKVSLIRTYPTSEDTDPEVKSAREAVILDTVSFQDEVGICTKDFMEMKYISPQRLEKGWDWEKGDKLGKEEITNGEVYFLKEESPVDDYLFFGLGELYPLKDYEGYEAVIPIVDYVDLWIRIGDTGDIMNQELFVDLGSPEGKEVEI